MTDTKRMPWEGLFDVAPRRVIKGHQHTAKEVVKEKWKDLNHWDPFDGFDYNEQYRKVNTRRMERERLFKQATIHQIEREVKYAPNPEIIDCIDGQMYKSSINIDTDSIVEDVIKKLQERNLINQHMANKKC